MARRATGEEDTLPIRVAVLETKVTQIEVARDRCSSMHREETDDMWKAIRKTRETVADLEKKVVETKTRISIFAAIGAAVGAAVLNFLIKGA